MKVDYRPTPGVVALGPGHPYLRLPIQFATSLRRRILDAGLMTKPELDEAIVECEKVAGDPQTTGVTFVVTAITRRLDADECPRLSGGCGNRRHPGL